MSTRDSSTSRPGRDSGLVFDTLSLGRRPGSMRTVERKVPSPSRIGLDLIAIEENSEIDLDLRLESVSEGVLVTGSVRADAVGECSRCLESFTESVDVYLTELFAYPNSVTEQTTEDDAKVTRGVSHNLPRIRRRSGGGGPTAAIPAAA